MVAGSYRAPSRSSTRAPMSCSGIMGGQSLSRSWALHHMLLLTSVCPLTGAWVIGASCRCALSLVMHSGSTTSVQATCLEVFCEDVVDLLGNGCAPVLDSL